MSFFSGIFKKRSGPGRTSTPDKPAERGAPAKTPSEALSAIRHRAHTGDPRLVGKHHSGSF